MIDTERIAETGKVFQVLIRGRIVEKVALQDRLMQKDAGIDRDYLRRLLLQELEGDYSVDKAQRAPRRGVRSWLLNFLGRVADDDAPAGEYVRKHLLVENEPDEWARYWSLDSLVVTEAADLVALAEKIHSKDDSPLVNNLAKVILARGNPTDQLLGEIKQGVEAQDWSIIRALRVVPLEDTIEALCDIVNSEELSEDTTYDAVVALGAVPADWPDAGKAVDALMACVKRCRQHPWWDAMRSKALSELKKFASRDAVPLLIEELSDSNPSIVFEAARALERTLGVQKAAGRIVEAASQTGEEAVQQYANALRWMVREDVVEELETLMMSGSADQKETAQALLSEVGGRAAFEKLRARTNAMKQHLDLLESTEKGIREMFDNSLVEARKGYSLATWMDTVVFYLGVALIVVSIILVFQDKETIAGLTATGGALSVIYNLFLGGPRRRVQEAVVHLMSLKVIFLGYLRQLHQADQAFVRQFLEDKPLTPEVLKRYADLVGACLQDAVAHIRLGANSSIKASDLLPGKDAAPTNEQPAAAQSLLQEQANNASAVVSSGANSPGG